jgi:hypothetical protein
MPNQPIDPLQEQETQHILLLQLLRKDHPPSWRRAELARELYDVDPDAISVALERLREQGVVHPEGEHVSASACARHLDALNLICI